MRSTAILLTAFLLALPAFAAEKAGDIKLVNGKVEVLKEQQVVGRAAKPGTEFLTDDLIRTKRKSYAEVTFVDGSSVKIYERSRLKINGIERGKDYNADIQKGRVLFDIAKSEDVSGDFKVKTTTSIIGVKGTSFRIDVLPELTRVTVNEGVVEVSRLDVPEQSVLLNPGQSLLIRQDSDEMNVTRSQPETDIDYEDETDGLADRSALSENRAPVIQQPNLLLTSLQDGTRDIDQIYEKPQDRENLVEALTGRARIRIDFEH
ncbi:hypothetical protein EP073_00830 [Geovibrio thiophilus]|uniref:FecR protein domain-containing protein n=1 Tax=Geovibrio thiophilus TaxID=139438 RepID=A0A3R5UW58_9BACT|nr:FecR family protein [Geovibrio thiophilus]QAR31995.1 hypothetical protein EP073_00830 [Geovibrio thiophilus]